MTVKRATDRGNVFVGCAGWSIPRAEAHHFPESGSHLERYAQRFSAVEINSSFYRPHRNTTYVRWADTVPADFRFSVKVPKTITHIARLENTTELMGKFLGEVAGLGEKLGCLLVQLPPSLAFNLKIARNFFKCLRATTDVAVALEPRHASWWQPAIGTLLENFNIAQVVADPPPVPANAEPKGWNDFVYYRLHGSPRIYYSTYPASFLEELGQIFLLRPHR